MKKTQFFLFSLLLLFAALGLFLPSAVAEEVSGELQLDVPQTITVKPGETTALTFTSAKEERYALYTADRSAVGYSVEVYRGLHSYVTSEDVRYEGSSLFFYTSPGETYECCFSGSAEEITLDVVIRPAADYLEEASRPLPVGGTERLVFNAPGYQILEMTGIEDIPNNCMLTANNEEAVRVDLYGDDGFHSYFQFTDTFVPFRTYEIDPDFVKYVRVFSETAQTFDLSLHDTYAYYSEGAAVLTPGAPLSVSLPGGDETVCLSVPTDADEEYVLCAENPAEVEVVHLYYPYESASTETLKPDFRFNFRPYYYEDFPTDSFFILSSAKPQTFRVTLYTLTEYLRNYAIPVEEGEPQTLTFRGDWRENTYLRFTPETTDSYTIYEATSGTSLTTEILDSRGSGIAFDDSYELQAGETYYYELSSAGAITKNVVISPTHIYMADKSTPITLGGEVTSESFGQYVSFVPETDDVYVITIEDSDHEALYTEILDRSMHYYPWFETGDNGSVIYFCGMEAGKFYYIKTTAPEQTVRVTTLRDYSAANGYQPISAEEPFTVPAGGAGQRFFTFTPPATGQYMLLSNGQCSTHVFLFGPDFRRILHYPYDAASDTINIRIIADFIAGETYYFGFDCYDYYSQTETFTVTAELPHGECGDGVTWVFNNHTFTVSGEGAMADYYLLYDYPWREFFYYNLSRTAVVLEEGVTYLGKNAIPHLGNGVDVIVLNKNCDLSALDYCTILRGYLGSTAEAFAKEHPDACTFIPLCPADRAHAVTEKETAFTCRAAQTTGWYCEDCGAWLNGDAVLRDHPNAQTAEAIPSTCTEQGRSAGVYCPDCGVWLSGHEALPLADHTWSGWTVTQQPTADREGTETRTCSVCGAAETRSIDKLTSTDGESESAPNLIQKIVQWFRNLFEKIAALFRF
jgi:hypothetical protein